MPDLSLGTGQPARVAAPSIRDVLAPGGLLERHLPGYESRPAQLALAERIGRALHDDERLLVEAGTGTGKTLAYLVPAILSGRKVIVSTATRTLQDQIAGIDLPRLASLLPGRFSFAVMKGLGNYVCRRRLDELGQQQILGGEAEPPHLARLRAWTHGDVTGDRSDLADVPDDWTGWRDVTAAPELRIGPRCRFFESCFVTAMRRRGAEADVVVVNHHLYFADLALRARWPEAQVLPPHEVVIFDEAHALEDVATEFFGLQVSTARLLALGRDIGKAFGAERGRTAALGARLVAVTQGLADALRRRLPAARNGQDEIRVEMPPDLWNGEATARYHELDTVLEEAAAFLAGAAEPGDRVALAQDDDPAQRAAAAALGGLSRRAAAVRDELGTLVDGTPREHVRWIVASGRGVALRASPVEVGPLLGRAFDEHPGPVVFASATLTVAGNFSYVRRQLGLHDAAAEATFPSPFRYDRQALLYVASDLPEPREATFSEAAAERVAALCEITKGRALILFTSFRNLRVAEARLRERLPYPLLVQGERPRHVLLSALRHDIGSVLLATASFWEGVDVPGEALSLVVMDKIPFAVPDDPLVAARIARIEAEGEDGFGAYQVPRAALSLKQGFGRLVRTHADVGIVAILDGRVLRRAYGGPLLASLPRDVRRTDDLHEVAAFWHGRQGTDRPAHGP